MIPLARAVRDAYANADPQFRGAAMSDFEAALNAYATAIVCEEKQSRGFVSVGALEQLRSVVLWHYEQLAAKLDAQTPCPHSGVTLPLRMKCDLCAVPRRVRAALGEQR